MLTYLLDWVHGFFSPSMSCLGIYHPASRLFLSSLGSPRLHPQLLPTHSLQYCQRNLPKRQISSTYFSAKASPPQDETQTCWVGLEGPPWSNHSSPHSLRSSHIMIFYAFMSLHILLPPPRRPSPHSPYSFQTSFPRWHRLLLPKKPSLSFIHTQGPWMETISTSESPTRLSTPRVQADVKEVFIMTSPRLQHSVWHKTDIGQTWVIAALQDGFKEQTR